MTPRGWHAALAAALAIATVGLALVAQADDAPAARTNPHGAPDGCTACHAPGSDVPLPVVATCRGCHPTADMHPVGMPPSSTQVPHSFPLEDGKVVCSTCHAEPAHGGVFAALPAPFHRGGPYESPKDLCWSCHVRTTLERVSPHHPTSPRDPQSPTCTACHTTAPLPGAAVAQARLRLAPDQACTATCHTTAPHAGAAEHVGHGIPEDGDRALPAAVALAPDGTIQCFTCHEPHGDGARTARDDTLCRACHGDGP